MTCAESGEFRLIEVTANVSDSLSEAVSVPALESLIHHVLVQEKADGHWTVAIQFTSDDEMQRMHAEFMGLDSPTDIMTFPYDADDWGETGTVLGANTRGGDLIISIDRARDQAGEGNWDVADELFFLVCHGMLHLLGWDDATAETRQVMLRRQREIMRTWRRI